MLKLPSLQGVLRETGYTLKRFPLPVLAVITGVSASIYMVHQPFEVRHEAEELLKIIMCCSLGLNLFISIQLFSESKKLSRLQNISIQAVALTLLITYYFTLPLFKDFALKDGIRYTLFNIGLHLLVSFSPFIASGTTNGFWQFNRTLFIRFLTSCIYTGVLYIGLALALLAIDELFKVNVNSNLYADLWFILIGIFNTCFFLAGVPKQIETLDADTTYPKGLKIFTQFVLLPLVTIYLLILYAYGTKITILMELPRGWVSYLVISLSIAGILSLLLIWPIRNEEGNNWIKIVDRWFYRALYPLIILLGLAIYKRVSQYGITENRYFILLIALWLAAIATYFLISKTKNIKVIPVSLCIIAFLSSFGPWGAFSVSERSQVNRLERLLTKENLLVNEKIKRADSLIQNENTQAITSLVNYLDENHGFEAIQPWFTQNLDSLFVPKDTFSDYVNKRQIILDLIGVDNYNSYTFEGRTSFNIQSEFDNYSHAIDVKGFDYYLNFNQNFYGNDTINAYYLPLIFDRDTLYVKYRNNELLFFKNQKLIKNVDFVAYIKGLRKHRKPRYEQYDLTKEQLSFPVETDSFLLQLNFNSITGSTDEKDNLELNGINAHVLIKRK